MRFMSIFYLLQLTGVLKAPFLIMESPSIVGPFSTTLLSSADLEIYNLVIDRKQMQALLEKVTCNQYINLHSIGMLQTPSGWRIY